MSADIVARVEAMPTFVRRRRPMYTDASMNAPLFIITNKITITKLCKIWSGHALVKRNIGPACKVKYTLTIVISPCNPGITSNRSVSKFISGEIGKSLGIRSNDRVS